MCLAIAGSGRVISLLEADGLGASGKTRGINDSECGSHEAVVTHEFSNLYILLCLRTKLTTFNCYVAFRCLFTKQ